MSKNLRTFMRDAVARFPGSIKVIDAPVDRRFEIQAYAVKFAGRGEYPTIEIVVGGERAAALQCQDAAHCGERRLVSPAARIPTCRAWRR